MHLMSFVLGMAAGIVGLVVFVAVVGYWACAGERRANRERRRQQQSGFIF